MADEDGRTEEAERAEYRKVLAEVRERLTKYANRIYARNRRILFDHMGTPEEKRPAIDEFGFGNLIKHHTEFLEAAILVLAEQEMRIRGIEKVFEDAGEFVRKHVESYLQSQKDSGEKPN